MADYDGDGKTDIAWTARTAASGVRSLIALGNGSFQSGISSSPATSGNYNDYSAAINGDFNGDGREDLVWTRADASGLKAVTALSTGAGQTGILTSKK